MSYRTAISIAAAAIGISCIATDASARGGGGGGGGHGGAGPASFHVSPPATTSSSGHFTMERVGGVGAPGGGGTSSSAGAGGTNGTGAAAGTRYYAPVSYSGDNRTACGYYPYPPCHKIRTR
jgi:hypothetical protein